MNIDPLRQKFNITAVKASTPAISGKAEETLKSGIKEAPAEPKEKADISRSLFKSVTPKKAEGDKRSKSLVNDEYQMKDGFDSSRDIKGISFKEGKPNEPYIFRVEVDNLRPGAELGNLDVYTLISLGKGDGATKLPDDIPGVTSQPWNLAVGKYDEKNFKVINSNGSPLPEAVSGVKFDSKFNRIEFKLNKNILRDKGWKDGESLKLQAFTAKDFVKKVTDTLDEPVKKPWATDGTVSRYVDTARPESLNPQRDENWSDDVIYFVLTDRFQDGDKSNNMDVKPGDLRRYQGGDLQGLIDKMDYIKDLGVSTLWVTPVMDNQTDFVNSSGYHGYWPVNFFKVDEHLGNMDKFKEMVDTAHKKDLKVILDVPLNHVAWEHPFKNDPEKKDWFHQIGDIKDWNDPYQIENGSMYGLPDLAQENPKVYEHLMKASEFWIKEGGVDGFRLDAVQHVPRWFWDKYVADVKGIAGPDFFMVGEVFNGDPGKVGAYQNDGMPSLFDMPLYFTTKNVFAYDGSMKELAGKVNELNGAYENPSMMSAIIDNHDTTRFLTAAGNNGREKMKLALAFLTTVNRIPSIYYGTEQGMSGHEETFTSPPDNRANMKFGNDPDMEHYMKTLLHTRNESEALKHGTLLEMWKDDDVFAYSRMTPDDEAIVVLNNNYGDQSRDIALRAESQIPDGTVMKDAVSGREFTVQNHKINVSVGGKQPLVLVKK